MREILDDQNNEFKGKIFEVTWFDYFVESSKKLPGYSTES